MNRKNFFFSIFIIIGGIVLFFFFYYLLPYHFFHKEQVHLFLFNVDFLTQYLCTPAFLSSLLGDWLTQYYYLVGGAPAILALLLVVLGVVCYMLLLPYFKGGTSWCAMLIVLWEAGRQCALTYPLSATLSLIGGGLTVLLLKKIIEKSLVVGKMLAFLFIPLSYWFFGYGMWITLLFFILLCSKWMKIGMLIITFAILSITRSITNFTWNQTCSYPSNIVYFLPNFQREELLKVDIEYSRGRIDKLQSILRDAQIDHFIKAYYANLIDARQGKLPNRFLMRFKYGTNALFMPVHSKSDYLTIFAANEVWFALGDMTISEHASILGMIFSPRNKGTRAIKRLAEISLINEDNEGALKYLRILDKTMWHSDWAKARLPYKQTAEVKNWLVKKREYIHKEDTLRMSRDISRSLKGLLDSNSTNKIALDYLLCYHLLRKDIRSFACDLERYRQTRSLPNVYAEALLIYYTGLGVSSKQILDSGIPLSTVEEFNNYTKIYEQYGGQKKYLQAQYGDTYWLYFHFAQVKDEL